MKGALQLYKMIDRQEMRSEFIQNRTADLHRRSNSLEAETNTLLGQTQEHKRFMEEVKKEMDLIIKGLQILRNAAWEVGATAVGFLIQDLLIEPKSFYLSGRVGQVDAQTIVHNLDKELLGQLVAQAIMNDWTVNMPSKVAEDEEG